MKQLAVSPRHPLWRFLTASALVLTLAACGGGDTLSVQNDTLTATLSGDQETTPTVTGALGAGTLTLTLPTRALSGNLSFNGMTATAAHVHLGSVGSNGAVIVTLVESNPGNWSVPANTVLTDPQVTAFYAGGLYFNVHSTENPSGEIRGQIGREVFAAQLAASQEVPTNASTATGVGFVSLDPSTKSITARLTLSGMTAAAAHIHTGGVGVNGAVSFPLTETPAASGIWVSAAGATVTDAQITALKAGGLYFNAHSGAFPGGEIRGQIARNVGYATLNAGQEVPTNASTATGVGSLVIDAATRGVSGGIMLTGMTATAAHIHTGAAGTNGGVAIGLTDAGGGAWNVPANTLMTADQLKAFKQGNLYFNAHSAAFGGGETRGQIGREVFAAQLTATQEVPTNASTATGVGSVSLDRTTKRITARMTITGMTATVAHIHTGEVGVNGGVAFPLTETAAGSGIWVSAADATMTDAQITALKASGLYFNAHSTAFPGGEIRGQIGLEVFAARMTAGQEIPTNASIATGVGVVNLDPATKRITARMTLTGMTATVAHIHTGVAGVNGGVAFPLTETATGSGVWVAAAEATMTDAQITALRSGGLYFNAHSAAFGGGEIRGQIGREVFTALLSAGQEVPTNGSTATGVGFVSLDRTTKRIMASVALTGMTATMAHIHTGEAGVNGGVIFPLTETAAGSGIWVSAADGTMTDAQIMTLNASGLYFNAHSTAFPGGEIRGQIR